MIDNPNNKNFDPQKSELSRSTITLCTSCQKAIDDVDNFCKHCGINLKTTNASAADRTNLILDCIKNLPFEAGLNYVSKILKGSKSVLKRGNQKSDFCNYGVFSDDTIKQTKALLDELVDSGVLELYSVPKSSNLKVKIGDSNVNSEDFILEQKSFESIIDNSNPEKKPNQVGEPWSDFLDQELEFLFAKQLSMEELMKHFGRSKGGIRARLKHLGLLD